MRLSERGPIRANVSRISMCVKRHSELTGDQGGTDHTGVGKAAVLLPADAL